MNKPKTQEILDQELSYIQEQEDKEPFAIEWHFESIGREDDLWNNY